MQNNITTLLLGIQDVEVTGVLEERRLITFDCKHVLLRVKKTRYDCKDLAAYFSSIDRAERRDVEIFVSDICGAFKGMKEAFFPQSTHVIDRYHFIRQVHWPWKT